MAESVVVESKNIRKTDPDERLLSLQTNDVRRQHQGGCTADRLGLHPKFAGENAKFATSIAATALLVPPESTKIVFGWGCAPNPAGELAKSPRLPSRLGRGIPSLLSPPHSAPILTRFQLPPAYLISPRPWDAGIVT